ncbi:site-specific integrase [Alistipes sp. OttesenSCG-928-B03]|nr:site-specific integrase [Alistipes sp. OttesenSCG-928-B03]
MNVSLSIICYKSKHVNVNQNPLMIRICMDGKRKYHSIGVAVEPIYWDFTKNQPKRNCPNKEYINQIIRTKESELQKRIFELQARGEGFTIDDIFEDSGKIQAKTVGEFYTTLIEKYQKKGETGNARIYLDSYRSIKTFRNDRMNFIFADITVRWLEKYEAWMREKGCKETTMSVLFRTLRSTYNKAIQAGAVDKKAYPFNNYKISKYDTKTQKRAISKEDIMKIMQADLSGKRENIRLSRDIFVFSYFCGGINFTDIANLTSENISEGRLQYIRQKTGKKINLPLQDIALEIIARYADNDRGHLFPILDKREHKTPLQKHNRIHKMIGKVNLNLREIAQIAGVSAYLTTYVARHSFATILKRSGVNIGIISESLGHSDLATTQIYLDSFENSQIDEAMKNLL